MIVSSPSFIKHLARSPLLRSKRVPFPAASTIPFIFTSALQCAIPTHPTYHCPRHPIFGPSNAGGQPRERTIPTARGQNSLQRGRPISPLPYRPWNDAVSDTCIEAPREYGGLWRNLSWSLPVTACLFCAVDTAWRG